MGFIQDKYKIINKKGLIGKINIVLALIIIGTLAYILFAPVTPAKFQKPIVTNASSLIAGGTINYTLYSCRYVDESVITTVTRKLVSTDNMELAPILLSQDVVTNPKRCLNNKRTLIIPLATPQGHYKLVITALYQIIPLRSPIAVSASSDSFTVKASTTSLDIESLLDENSKLQEQIDDLSGN